MVLLTNQFYVDHQAIKALEITTEGIPNLHLLCAFGARTATIALLSIVMMIAQNLRYFLVILLMNLFREGFEKFIDPLHTLANALVSPMVDFIMHIVIVAIEL